MTEEEKRERVLNNGCTLEEIELAEYTLPTEAQFPLDNWNTPDITDRGE